MKPGEAFEIRCYNYLTKYYGSKNSTFYHEGGMDSTKSDIAVLKNGTIDYYIEVKDSNAQSGQFVLSPNITTQTFVFSPRNRSQPNELTQIMIDYMNNNFTLFNNAGTAGQVLNINSSIFSNWIIDHYMKKNVKYIMSCKNSFVIFPIQKFASYFDIVAKYRIKKSGSTEPAQKDHPYVIAAVKSSYPSASFSTDGKKLFATISGVLSNDRFTLGNYTYYLSKRSDNLYEIRKLSNTYGMNVIFEIKLKKSQDLDDLNDFISQL